MVQFDFTTLPWGPAQMPVNGPGFMVLTYNSGGLAATELIDQRGIHCGLRATLDFWDPMSGIELKLLNGAGPCRIRAEAWNDGMWQAGPWILIKSLPTPQIIKVALKGLRRISTEGSELYLETMAGG